MFAAPDTRRCSALNTNQACLCQSGRVLFLYFLSGEGGCACCGTRVNSQTSGSTGTEEPIANWAPASGLVVGGSSRIQWEEKFPLCSKPQQLFLIADPT